MLTEIRYKTIGGSGDRSAVSNFAAERELDRRAKDSKDKKTASLRQMTHESLSIVEDHFSKKESIQRSIDGSE